MKTSPLRLFLILLFSGCLLAVPPAAAQAQVPAPGVAVSPAASEQWGAPGTLVSHTLTMSNTGTDADSYTISLAGNAWNTWASANTIDNLAAGAQATFTVTAAVPANAGVGDSDTVTVTVTSTTDPFPAASAALTTRAVPPTATPQPAVTRPLVVIRSYGTGHDAIAPKQQFDLSLTLVNNGQSAAANLVVTFEGGDFVPRDTGGVLALSSLGVGASSTLTQPMQAGDSLSGKSVASVNVKIAYTDPTGTAYNEAFTLAINLKAAQSYSGPPRPTATPTAMLQPQIVVSAYRASVDPLQPGTVFDLELDIRNLGSADARTVTLVLGGSGAAVPEAGSGTPQPGGLSGGSSELTHFAPLGSSNLAYLGDIPVGAGLRAIQRLIVNVTTQPGAYSLKLSFVYSDNKNNRRVDDQVITLLVYSLPQVEVSFYRDPGVFFTGQPNILPLQVTNLSRKSAVLGNMTVSAQNAEVSNNVTLVGALEPGGYYTLDASVIPQQAGPLEITTVITYTDDFNQTRTVEQTLTVEVQETPVMETGGPGMPGEMPPDLQQPETFWQKVLRFVKGLIGLDSAPPQPAGPPGEVLPEDSSPAGPQKAPGP